MLLPFFEWCEQLWLGQFIVGSNWLFPVIESVHLLGLSVLGGAILVVDMRLLGLGLKNHPVTELARDARPWLIGALVVMIATGIPLFLSESVKCYYSQAFWNKMTALAIGLVFTFTIRARVTETESVGNTARRQAVVGALSLALWFTVAASGRWIGFS
ncbi:MAG: hypothetical protein Q7R30_05780 [Acidobacteriota bacterium]|nr:hypothetical protein [Acidobacteriota bacterium]